MSKQTSGDKPRFKPEQLASSKRFARYRYIIRAVLKPEKTYTVEEVEQAIRPFITKSKEK